MKFVAQKLIVAITIFLITVIAANLVINNPYTHRLVSALIYDRFSEQSNLHLEFEALSISVLPLRITVYGIQVDPVSKFQSPALARISHLQVSISWWEIFLGKIAIDKILAQDVEAYWPPPWDFEGLKLNERPVERTINTGEKVRIFDHIPFNEIEFKNARIFARTTLHEEVPFASEYLYTAISGLDFRLKLKKRWNRMDLAFKAEKFQVFINERTIIDESRLACEGTLQDNKITTSYLNVKSKSIDLKGVLIGDLRFGTSAYDLVGIDFQNSWEGSADLKLLGNFLDLPGTSGPLLGQYNIDFFLPLDKHEKGSFTLSADVQTDGGMLGDFKLFQSGVKLVLDQDKIIFDNVDLRVGDAVYGQGTGRIDLDDTLKYNFSIKPKNFPLSKLLPVFDTELEDFDFLFTSDNLKIKGIGYPLNLNLQAEARFHAIDLPNLGIVKDRYLTPPSCQLNVNMNISNDKLSFSDTRGSCVPHQSSFDLQQSDHSDMESELQIQGDIFFEEKRGVNLTATGSDFNINLLQYYLQVPLSGRIDLISNIKGPYKEIRIKNQIQGEDVSIARIPLAEMKLENVLDGSSVKWFRAGLKTVEGGEIYSSQGELETEKMEFKNFKIKATKLDHVFVRQLNMALFPDSRINFKISNLQATWNGPVKYPAICYGDVDVWLTDVNFDEEHFFDHFRATMQGKGNIWKFSQTKMQLGKIKLGATAQISKTEKFSPELLQQNSFIWSGIGYDPNDKVSISIKSLDVEQAHTNDLNKIPYIGKYLEKIKMRGKAKLDADLQGSMSDLHGNIDLSIEKLSIFNASLAPISFRGFLDSGKLNVIFDHSGGSLEGRLSLNLVENTIPFEWYFQFRGFDIRALMSRYFFQDPRNYAYFTGAWKLKGTLASWWNSLGTLNIEKLRVKYNRESDGKVRNVLLENTKDSTINFTKEGMRFAGNEPLRMFGEYFELVFKIHETTSPQFVDFTFNAQVKADLLAQFSKHVESASGIVGVDGNIKGPIDDVKLSARIFDVTQDRYGNNVEPLSIGFPDLRPEFQDIKMDLDYQKGFVKINRLTAKKGLGTVKVTGLQSFREGSHETPTNVNIVLDQIRAIYPVPYLKSFDTILSGEIQISGQERPYLVAGDVRIEKARSTRKINLRDEVVNVIRQESITSQLVDNSEEMPFFNLNINFFADKSIAINNRSLQVLMSSELQLEGSEKKQKLLGHIDIESGKFIYKREFTVTRGEIVFDDPVKTNPKLDIIAITDIHPYKVTIAVSGAASKPIIEILVDPPTREDDGSVISSLDALVLLSRGSLPDVNRKAAEVQGVGLSEFFNIFGSQGKVPFEKISEKFGQDLIQVYPDLTTDEEGLPVLRLNGTVKITDNVEAVYGQTQKKLEVSLGVPIHNNISLSGKVEQFRNEEEGTENASVDLRFRFSIK